MTSSSPDQQTHGQFQPTTAYQQQQQQQLPRRRPSTSAGRSIISVFSNEVDAIELKQYTPNPPQIHEDSDHDDHLQGGQTTPDSCSNEDGSTNTGVTTPELKEVPLAAISTSSSASSAGHVHSRLSIFWRNNISIIVPSKDARDHLGRQLYSVSAITSPEI